MALIARFALKITLINWLVVKITLIDWLVAHIAFIDRLVVKLPLLIGLGKEYTIIINRLVVNICTASTPF